MTQRLRNSGVAYHVLVDRFAASTPVSADRWSPLDDDPSQLRGGDLAGLMARLDHLSQLEVDTLVLAPVWPSESYDGLKVIDHFDVAEALGGEPAFVALCQEARARDMRVVLTGVFDRVGRSHPWFVEGAAQRQDDGEVDPGLRRRSFFSFDDRAHGYASYRGDPAVPALNLDDHSLRHKLFHSDRSAIRVWLERGASGWLLEGADAFGFNVLHELVRSVHSVREDCVVIGDSRAFADQQVRDCIIDGVVNHYMRVALLGYLRGELQAQELARMLSHQRNRYGARALLRCWVGLSDLKTERLVSALGASARLSQMAVCLQYLLPGTVHVVYGDEVGLASDTSAGACAPMEWDPARWDGPLLQTYQRMGALRRRCPALVTGDVSILTPMGEEDLFALVRYTRDPRETVIAAFNRGGADRRTRLFVPVDGLADGTRLRDLLSDAEPRMECGTIVVDVPAHGAVILLDAELATRLQEFRRP